MESCKKDEDEQTKKNNSKKTKRMSNPKKNRNVKFKRREKHPVQFVGYLFDHSINALSKYLNITPLQLFAHSL